MVKVGGEVDAFCTRCELTLAHTIHALMAGRPVKVECNTCHSVHRYRGQSEGSRPRASRTDPSARAKAVIAGFEELLARRDAGKALPYSPKKRFSVDDVVDHPVFGRGFVSAIRDGDKIEITFRSEVKVLVHGR
jgi:hypothetical protein